MCGIAGIVDLDGAPIESGVLRRMGHALRHRGPDAEGVHLDCAAAPAVGLVHRRLAIIDLSRKADQPLGNEDGSILAMLNGEIYNFQELRAGLAPRHTFRSKGDTEVLVHGYEERGEAVVGDLDGMFALALWDAKRRRLVVARDAFGKKPLYYARRGSRFVFASELKGVLVAGVEAAMAEENLAEYLAFGYVPTPRTLYRGIFKLPPASLLVVDHAGVSEPRPYWDLRFPKAGEAAQVSLDEAADTVRSLLTEAVRKRLVSDVPLGLLLSGGVDSSAVAAVAAGLRSGGRIKTFCVGFEGDAFFDERPHARRVAEHVGTEHHEDVVRPQAAALVETLLHHHDEPFGDSSALPTYLVSKAARAHVTVALNGDGGDEAFAGYGRFHAALLAEKTPRPILSLARGVLKPIPRGLHPNHPLRRLRRFADKASRPFVERIFAWSAFFDLDDLRDLGGPALADEARVLSSYREAFDACAGSSVLSRLLYLNARTYLLDDLLPKMDRMSMAHGLEARSPFLDRPLVEYAASLPDAYKRRGSTGKVVLKRAIADVLPDSVLRRPKQGFGVPLGLWFRQDLKPVVVDTLLAQPRLGAFLAPPAVERLYAAHLRRSVDAGHQLWTLLTLELWLRGLHGRSADTPSRVL